MHVNVHAKVIDQLHQLHIATSSFNFSMFTTKQCQATSKPNHTHWDAVQNWCTHRLSKLITTPGAIFFWKTPVISCVASKQPHHGYQVNKKPGAW